MKSNLKLRTAIAALVMGAIALASAPALAYSGVVTGVVGKIDFDQFNPADAWISLSPAVAMCGTGTTAVVYTSSTDTNYKQIIAALLVAKLQGSSVTLSSTASGPNCHLDYVSTP